MKLNAVWMQVDIQQQALLSVAVRHFVSYRITQNVAFLMIYMVSTVTFCRTNKESSLIDF